MKIFLKAEYDPKSDPEREKALLDSFRNKLFSFRSAIWSRLEDGGLEITLQ
jgi:hypothetical protein